MIETSGTAALPERFLWAYVFGADGVGRKIAAADVDAALASGEGWLWLHVALANARAREWIDRAAPFPDAVRDILLDDTERLQLEAAGDTLAGVLADVRRDIGRETTDIARLRFAADRKVLLTCRRSALHCVEDTHAAVDRGRVFGEPSDLLAFVVGRFVDVSTANARGIGEKLDHVEDILVEADGREEADAVAAARRAALALHRQLQALALLFAGFLEEEGGGPARFRALAERLDRRLALLDRDVQALQDRARLLQDEISAKVAAGTSRNLEAISVMTALFLPATFVTGVFGMNTRGMFFGEDLWGTVYAIVCCALGSLISYLILRRLGVAR